MKVLQALLPGPGAAFELVETEGRKIGPGQILSGWGREFGGYGLEEYLEPKAVQFPHARSIG